MAEFTSPKHIYIVKEYVDGHKTIQQLGSPQVMTLYQGTMDPGSWFELQRLRHYWIALGHQKVPDPNCSCLFIGKDKPQVCLIHPLRVKGLTLGIFIYLWIIQFRLWLYKHWCYYFNFTKTSILSLKGKPKIARSKGSQKTSFRACLKD